MSKINRQDYFSDDLIAAPLELARNMETVLQVTRALVIELQNVAATVKQASTIEQLSSATRKVNEAQKEFESLQKSIQSTNVKLSEEYIRQADELAALREKQRDAAKEAQLSRQITQSQEGSIRQLELQLRKLKKEYSELSKAERENAEVGGKLLAEITQKDIEYKNLKKSIGDTNVNVGNYTQSIIDAFPALRNLTNGIQGFSLSLKSIPIFAVIGLIQTLVSYFTKTEDGALKLKVIMAGLSAIFDTFVDYLIQAGRFLSELTLDKVKQGFVDLGNSIKDFVLSRIEMLIGGLKGIGEAFSLLFKGEFEKAAKTAGQALLDIVHAGTPLGLLFDTTKAAVEGFGKAAKAVYEDVSNRVSKNIELQRRENDLMLKKRDFMIEEAKLNQVVAEAREQAADASVSDEEKLKALKTAEEALVKLYDEKIALREMENQIMKERDDLFENDIKANEEAVQREVELIKLREEKASALRNLTKQISALEKKIAEENRKEQIESIKKQNEEQLALLQQRLDSEVEAIQQAAIRGEITRSEAEKRINNLKKSLADDLIAQQIEGLKRLLNYDKLTADERAEIEKKIADLKRQYNEAVFQQIEDNQQQTVENTKLSFEEIAELAQNFTSKIGGLFKSLSDSRIQAIDAEIAKVDENAKRELAVVGNNEDAKMAIQQRAERERQKLEQRRKQERQQQARIEKALAIFDATINTALQVTKVLANPVLAALVAALGAIQIATIARQPIPQFAKGTQNAPGGLAIVGEKGSELVKEPSGKMWLTPNKPAIVNLPKGSQVIPNDKTMSYLTRSFYSTMTTDTKLRQIVSEGNEKIVRAIRSTNKDYIKSGSLLFEVISDEIGNMRIKRRAIMG